MRRNPPAVTAENDEMHAGHETNFVSCMHLVFFPRGSREAAPRRLHQDP
jgi:hypothetical protein